MINKLKWGFIGTGFIAHQFAKGLQVLPDEAEIIAVCNVAKIKADKFAKEFNIKNSYSNLEDMLNNTDIDIVYVATPNTNHQESVLKSLKAGKAVLCEKPMGVNYKEVQKMVNYARRRNIFLMEACWVHFQPVWFKVREWVSNGMIGEPRLIDVDFGFRKELDPKGRLFNLNMAGGAIMDVGIYGISLATMLFEPIPIQISSYAHIGETGVDEQTAVMLKFSQGQLATLKFAVRTDTPQTALICGTEGFIQVPMFWRATEANLAITTGGELYNPVTSKEHVELAFKANGYEYEAQEVMKCVRSGKIESDIMSLDKSLNIIKIIDEIRRQIRLKFPVE